MARKTRSVTPQTAIETPPRAVPASSFQAHVYPDAWANHLKLKVDGHPFTLKGREFQSDIIRDESEWIVMPKGAQMGLTTVFLVRTFHWIVKRKWHHLYLLPLKTGAGPFAQRRVDSIIDSNDELARIFKSVDNKLHKQTIEDIVLMIRGTNIWTELREIPTDVLVMDERDKMVEENIPEAEARLDGSHVKRVVELSTPTQPGHGVDSEDAWHASDQHRWFVPCPHCGRRQTFTVEENVVIGDSMDDSFCRCAYCKKVITDVQRGEINEFGSWEAENPGGSKRGYHINQLHSSTQTMPKFMKNYFNGQTDSRKLRAWYNNNLGLPFVAFGDQVTPELVQACVPGDFQRGGIPNGAVFVGIDQGNSLHVRADYLDRWNRRCFWQIKEFVDKPGEKKWDQLDKWLGELTTWVGVIDIHPEKTKAQELVEKYYGRLWLGIEFDRPDQADTAVWNDPKRDKIARVSIDRTAAFDTYIGRLIKGNMIFPSDVMTLGTVMPRLPYNGYVYQLCQQVRDEEEDTKGRWVARWKANKNPDHWHHADMFCEIATMTKPYVNVTPAFGELFNRSGSMVAA